MNERMAERHMEDLRRRYERAKARGDYARYIQLRKEYLACQAAYAERTGRYRSFVADLPY